MTSQISHLWHRFNTPYEQKQDNDRLYDLSEGGNYSFTTDAANWALSFSVNLLFIKVFTTFPLTLIEGITIVVASTIGAALTKRITGFTQEKKTNSISPRPWSNLAVCATYAAISLCALPRITQISYQKMWSIFTKNLFPMPFIFVYKSGNAASLAQTQINKIKKIHQDYATHQTHLNNLSIERQTKIYEGMVTTHLPPPAELIKNPSPVLKQINIHHSIFHRIDPKEHPKYIWLQEKTNQLLKKLHFKPLATIEESNQINIQNRLKYLDTPQLDWLILDLIHSKKPELNEKDFDLLKERIKNIKEAGRTELVKKLEKANDLTALRTA